MSDKQWVPKVGERVRVRADHKNASLRHCPGDVAEIVGERWPYLVHLDMGISDWFDLDDLAPAEAVAEPERRGEEG